MRLDVDDITARLQIGQELLARLVAVQPLVGRGAVFIDARLRREDGDYLLLNSDGLTNMISDSEICDIVTSDISLSEKTETLIRFANNAGGLDNITVALVRFDKEDKA